MNRQEQYEKHKEYVESNELDKLINFQVNINHENKVFDAVSRKLDIPFPPETDDLIRLHKFIRNRKPFTILQFGLGYSTIILLWQMLWKRIRKNRIL